MYEIGLISDQGKVRPINQDALFADTGKLLGDDYALLAVADGMGGHRAGEVASQLAIDSFREHFLAAFAQETSPLLALELAARRSNQQIFERAAADYRLFGMGTTLTAALLWRERLLIGHVGDSRLYRFRNHNCEQLTDDHSLVGELYKSGSLSEQEAQRHPQRNMLIRCLGTSQTVDVDLVTSDLVSGDVVLLCSDGLYTALSQTELAEIIDANPSPQEAVTAMTQLANERGGRDNITAILVRWRWDRP